MRCRWVAVLVVACGCGRVGFEPGVRTGDSGVASDVLDATDPSSDASALLHVAYLKASNTESFDNFGHAVAISADGNTLAISAIQEDGSSTTVDGLDNNGAPQAGAVYVFVRSGPSWVQQAYLKPLNTGAGDGFGWCLALSSNGARLVVGAPLEDSASTGVNNASGDVTATYDGGAAYVFGRSGTTWAQQAYLKPSNTDAADDFGVAVAISGDGDTVAVGAGHEDSPASGIDQNQAQNSATDAGAVYVFRFLTGWTQEAYVKASNTGAGDDFGGSVALSTDGNTLAVGAASEDSGANTIGGSQTDNGVTAAGAVYVFTRTITVWSQQVYIKPSRVGFGDYFGRRLALAGSGDTLAVSSPGDDTVIANSGGVFVFVRSGTVWSEQTSLKAPNPGDGDQFGSDVALSATGDSLLVGAPLEDSAAAGLDGDQTDDTLMDSGAVYLFVRSNTSWGFTSYVKSFAPTLGDQFGTAVGGSIDGLVGVFSGSREDSASIGVDQDATNDAAPDSGAAYVIF